MPYTRTLGRHTKTALTAATISFCAFGMSACGGDDDGGDTATSSAGGSSSGSRWSDASLSYQVPDRWDPESVAMTLESSMIGGGVGGSGGTVSDDALFVGADLNSVKRSSADGGVMILQATPLKASSVEQEDYRIEGFTRDNTNYVSLWRKGVPESNDERRLGDETSSDAEVFLSVWKSDGTPVFDGALTGATEPGGVVGGLAFTRGDYRSSENSVFDPLTGAAVDTNTVGFDTSGHSVTDYSTKLDADDIRITRGQFYDHDFGNDSWRARDLVGAGDSDAVTFRGIIGDYAFFEGDGVHSGFAGSSSQDTSFIVNIPSGEISHHPDDSCTQPMLNSGPTAADNVPEQSIISPDGTKVVRGKYMYDATTDVFTCDEIRGNFEPRFVLDDGTVYGVGEQSSGDSTTQVAASMKIGDGEALKEAGYLPFYVDEQGRGWFADQVETDGAGQAVVFVLEPTS